MPSSHNNNNESLFTSSTHGLTDLSSTYKEKSDLNNGMAIGLGNSGGVGIQKILPD